MITVTRAHSWLVCNSDMGTLTRVGVLTIYFFFLESRTLARVVSVGGGGGVCSAPTATGLQLNIEV